MRTLRWRGSAALVSCALAASVGCGHTKTEVPGVFDFRSDASGASPAKEAPKYEARDGLSSLISGSGLESTSAKTFEIEERRWWAIGLVPLGDHDVKDEVKAASAGVAMRRVSVGEEESVLDGAYRFLTPAVPFVGGLTWTILMNASPLAVRMKGERVELGTANTPLDVPMTDAPAPDAPADAAPPPATNPAP